ncbi:MAG: addiction module protein [Coxiella sp. RIFCSPHIGHO2_12_FULL_42_15]|nr:MAG: addiction module protein [Coxiella sp. RIFCSPHIGHO2_12_FULL_42_15]
MDRNQPYNDLPLLPPKIDLDDPRILRKAINANRRLAELKGAVLSIPNQDILVNGIVLQEARLSSEIENIVTTNDELYRAAADKSLTKDPKTKEVLRYREALWHGLNVLETKPLSTNLFIEVVSIIKETGMSIRKVPGTKIASQEEIIYTPPEGESIIRDKLSNLEKFIHADDHIDSLIKLAIMHYQFEAIHPFTDGNGRTGRIINILFLVEKGLLDNPILFLSHYILKNKAQYYQCLRRVTENSAWVEWISYMLDAVEVTAKETQERVVNILEAMDKARELVRTKVPKIYSKDLIETIFMHPYSKVQFLVDVGLAKRQTAAAYLKQLEELGLLRVERVGKEQYYINTRLVQILSK